MRITRAPSSLSFGLEKTSLRWQNFFPIKSLQVTSLPQKLLWCPSSFILQQLVSKFTFVGCCQGISHWCLSPLPNNEDSITATQEGFRQKNDSFNTWTHVSSTTGWLEAISEKCEIKSCTHFCVLYLHPSERVVLKAEVVTMHLDWNTITGSLHGSSILS